MGQRSHDENRKYYELNNDKNTTYQNLWVTAKTMLKRKFSFKGKYEERRKGENQ